MLLALTVDALAVSAQAMVGRYEGATARRAANRLLGWGLVVGFGLAGVFFLARPWLPGFFTDDPAAMARVDAILLFVIWMQPLNALVFVWDGVFMGAEAFRYLAIQMVLSAALAAAALLLVVPLGWGLAGVWWGIVTLMGGRAVTLALCYGSGKGPGTARRKRMSRA